MNHHRRRLVCRHVIRGRIIADSAVDVVGNTVVLTTVLVAIVIVSACVLVIIVIVITETITIVIVIIIIESIRSAIVVVTVSVPQIRNQVSWVEDAT